MLRPAPRAVVRAVDENQGRQRLANEGRLHESADGIQRAIAAERPESERGYQRVITVNQQARCTSRSDDGNPLANSTQPAPGEASACRDMQKLITRNIATRPSDKPNVERSFSDLAAVCYNGEKNYQSAFHTTVPVLIDVMTLVWSKY